MTKANKQLLNKKWLLDKNTKRAAFLVLACFALFLISFGSYSIFYGKKVYSRQYIGSDDYGGKTKEQAKKDLNEKTLSYLNQEIGLVYQSEGEDKKYVLKPEEIGLQFDIDKTIDQVWGYGRDGNIFIDFWHQMRSLFKNNHHQVSYRLSEESLSKFVSEIANEVDIPEKDFEIVYNDEKFVLSDGRQEGKRIDQEKIKKTLKDQIVEIKINDIIFSSNDFKPQINLEKAEKRVMEANQILEQGELKLSFEDQEFIADKDTIGSFIASRNNGDDLELIFNEGRLKIFVESVASGINIEPRNSRLGMKNGKLVISTASQQGKTLDQDKAKVGIENALFARVSSKSVNADPKIVKLTVAIKEPEVSDQTISSLGINELIGTGTTNFGNSPANRVHNIEVGAAAINETLIKPGEEFSTLKTLGKIDASSGYLQELVIKENRTIPEFGGGLCQVSSTLFRAALNSGLKITERQNHKYRVSYYEPPVGMDATIYDPAPDFKFINNFDNYIFVQATISGKNITFDIYGTKDGRVAEISEPELYDIVDPGAPVEIESDTLPAGEKKMIEKAHQGATAKFNYKVSRGEEILQEKTFLSKYVPWPEKWLVGKGTPPPSESTPTLPTTPACNDSIQNGDESGVDCGGSCPNQC